MRLDTLLKLAGLKKYIKNLGEAPDITSVCSDSRKADSNSVFVCIVGAVTDGHTFAPAAYGHGCRVFFVSHRLALPDDAIQLVNTDTRAVLADHRVK